MTDPLSSMTDALLIIMGFAIPLVAICGGLILAGLSLHRRMRLRELAYRERMAMIERGLVPPPETDPLRFEKMMRVGDPAVSERVRSRATRRRSAGVLLIGVGLGLMMIIYFAGRAPGAAIGVGGSTIAIGLAMVVNALLDQRQPESFDMPRPIDRGPTPTGNP